MTDSLYSPVMPPNFYPITAPAAQSAPKSGGLNFNALLGASVFGGAAAYGVYNLDYFKNPMTKEMFEDALRSGKEIDYKSLTGAERICLNAAKNGMNIMNESQINNLFGGAEHLTYIDYLKKQYPDRGITTIGALERAVEKAKGNVDPNSSSAKDIEKHKTKIEKAEKLEYKSERLSNIENKLIELQEEHIKAKTAYEEAKTAQAEADNAYKSLAADANQATKDTAAKTLKDANHTLRRAESKRNSLSNQLKDFQGQRNTLESEMKQIISDSKIGDVVNKHGYSENKELMADLEVGNKDLTVDSIKEAAERRKTFFKNYSNNITEDYNNFLKTQMPKSSDELTKMCADLELVKAAESGNGLICKDMVQDIYAEASKSIGKGEAGIAKAFEKVKLKLPKGAGSFSKAGIAGLGITLGLYLLNNSKS